MHGSVTKSPISFTTWLPITLLALLALILLWLCYRKCKKQHALSRIGSSDVNQRLVTGVDVHQSVTSTTGPKISSCKIQKTSNVAINNDGANKDTKLTTITENARNLILDKGSLRSVVKKWLDKYFLFRCEQLDYIFMSLYSQWTRIKIKHVVGRIRNMPNQKQIFR